MWWKKERKGVQVTLSISLQHMLKTYYMLIYRAVSSTAAFDMYLGQLFIVDDYRTFGCCSNTHNKIIVICENATTDTGGIKETIAALNVAFVNAIQNTFQMVGSPLTSKLLDDNIHQIVQRHNNIASKRKA